MYNFIVSLISPPINFTLGFKEEGLAKAARENIHSKWKEYLSDAKSDEIVTIKDDYGHYLDAMTSNIAAILIQDQQGCMERSNDQNIDTARANDVFIKKRNGDMELMRLFPGNNGVMPFQGRG